MDDSVVADRDFKAAQSWRKDHDSDVAVWIQGVLRVQKLCDVRRVRRDACRGEQRLGPNRCGDGTPGQGHTGDHKQLSPNGGEAFDGGMFPEDPGAEGAGAEGCAAGMPLSSGRQQARKQRPVYPYGGGISAAPFLSLIHILT